MIERDTAAMSEEGCPRQAPGVRLRGVPELESAIVYSPESRELHWLNLGAWALLELCDGERKRREIEVAYARALDGLLSKDEVSRQVDAGLKSLESSGLIHGE